MKSEFFLAALLVAMALSAPVTHAVGIVELDPFNYDSVKEAREAWQEKEGSPAVTLLKGASGALRFPCPFQKDLNRVYWDHDIRIDLTSFTSFEVDLYCERPEALRGLAVYFKSGKGWYAWSQPLARSGRQTIHMSKNEFSTEGKPDGWHRIERIRFSPRKGESINTSITVYSIRARANTVLLIQGTTSAANDSERSYAKRTTRRISQMLDSVNIAHGIVEDQEVSVRTLNGARLAILGYNPNLPDAERRALKAFVDAGGKLIVFYSADAELARIMGMQLGAYTAAKTAGQWASFTFSGEWRRRLPERVYQNSWNIRPVLPLDHSARVIAYWENVQGRRTTDPAWVESDKGLWMTHVLLDDDLRNKQQMLLSMVCHYDPSLWRDAASQAVQDVGHIDSFRTLEEATTSIKRMARAAGTARRVEGLLDDVKSLFQRMLDQYQKPDYPAVVKTGNKLRSTLIEAYATAQRPRPGEFRGVWDHDGLGWYPGDWDKSCTLLRKHGMTAIFPNVAWGGLAHYKSQVLPQSDTLKQHGDQLEQCVDASHKHGIEVHAWKVCWKLEGAPEEFVARMKAEGRVQTTANGNGTSWLCPTHPANRELEIAAMKEMATRYNIDGIHLDYIRFPNSDSCYGTVCRGAFERWLAQSVESWPKDVQSGGSQHKAFLRWRAEVINHFVQQAYGELKAVRPDIKFSASVFGKYPECIEGVGQDWGLWLEKGWVDFVCPMNYTPDLWRFSDLSRKQLSLKGADGRVYPGIGVTSSESQLTPDLVIEQILNLQKHGADGFLLFKLNPTLRDDILPMLDLGLTR